MTDSCVNPENAPNVNQAESTKKAEKNIEGFDFLRAIFSVIVVAIHSDFFLLGEVLGSIFLTTLFRANVGYLAVPVFFQISLFLFYSKSEKVGSQYFLQKRLPKLVSLYLFWLISLIVFDVIFKEDSVFRKGVWSLKGFIEIMVSGNKSPFYFFFSLIFITTFTEIVIVLLRNIKNPLVRSRINYALLFASCGLVFILSFIESIANNLSGIRELKLTSLISSLSAWHYDPLNFLPYIFTTAIVVQEFKEGKLNKLTSSLKFKMYTLLALFIMFTLIEWSQLKELVHYARISIVFGSWLLLYLALLSTRKASPSIKFLSACSLGIYVFHPFFTHIFFPVNPHIRLTLSQIIPGLHLVVEFLVAIIGSIALTLIFRKIKVLRDFV